MNYGLVISAVKMLWDKSQKQAKVCWSNIPLEMYSLLYILHLENASEMNR